MSKKQQIDLTKNDIWDDSALVKAFDDALNHYQEAHEHKDAPVRPASFAAAFSSPNKNSPPPSPVRFSAFPSA